MMRKERGTSEYRRLRLTAGLLVAVAFFGGCTDFRSPGDVGKRTASLADSPVVTIGVVWPGDHEFGHAPEGVELAIDDVNEAISRLPQPHVKGALPPLYKRFRMRLSEYDDSANTSHKNIFKVATDMAGDPSLLAVVGYPHLQGAKRAAVVYSRYGILFLDPTVTSTVLSRIHLPYVFRLMYGERDEARAIANLLERLGYARVAVLTERQVDSITLSNFIMEEIDHRESGALAVGMSRYFVSTDNFYRDVVPELMSQHFDAIIISGNPHAASRLVTALRTMEVTTPLIGTNQLDTDEFVDFTQKRAEGMLITSAHDDRFDESPEGQAFSRRFMGRYGHPPDTPAIIAYEAVMFIRQAIVLINSVDPEKLDAALRYLPNFTGVSGQPYRFTDRGDIVGKGVSIRQVKGGALVPYELSDATPGRGENITISRENSR